MLFAYFYLHKKVSSDVKSNFKYILYVFLLLATNPTLAQNKSADQSLLRHIVVVTFKSGATDSQIKAFYGKGK